MGNVFSVARAFEHCGAETLLTDKPNEILSASHLVLPGVGAFADGMKELNKRSLPAVIKEFVSSNKPFIGICLGMQMLFDNTEEFGIHEGLGIIQGSVIAIPSKKIDGNLRKVPHIGWNKVVVDSNFQGKEPIFNSLDDSFYSYFVHSFTAIPSNPKNLLANCDYQGFSVTAAVKQNNVYGCQFHPEKSGETGLSIIRNFIALNS